MKALWFSLICAFIGVTLAEFAFAAGIDLGWDATVLRTDDTTIAPDTIASYQVFLNGLPVPAAQSVVTLKYSYEVAKGTCILPTDKWTVTATDSLGLVSAPSNPVSVAVKICTPKSNPAAPGNVKITVH
jgi:hypothetical protein